MTLLKENEKVRQCLSLILKNRGLKRQQNKESFLALKWKRGGSENHLLVLNGNRRGVKVPSVSNAVAFFLFFEKSGSGWQKMQTRQEKMKESLPPCGS